MTRLARITLTSLTVLALTAPAAVADDVQSIGGYTFTVASDKTTDTGSSYGTGDIGAWSYGTGAETR
jgi:hypothetical protein